MLNKNLYAVLQQLLHHITDTIAVIEHFGPSPRLVLGAWFGEKFW